MAVKSALEVLGKDYSAERQIAALASPVNDMQHQNGVFMVSSYYRSETNTFSIVPENFEKSAVTLSVRWLPPSTWLNNRDQFQQPNRELPEDFITDCAVWDLFHSSNSTSSLKDVECEGKTYQIRNQFFPYTVE